MKLLIITGTRKLVMTCHTSEETNITEGQMEFTNTPFVTSVPPSTGIIAVGQKKTGQKIQPGEVVAVV